MSASVEQQVWTIRLDGTTVPTKDQVGGKAHSLAWMRSLGLPVPEAFVLPTSVGGQYREAGNELPEPARAAVEQGLEEVEAATGRTLGSREAPLLVSVRSGAAQSMPGMMDTILNLGMNATTERALAEETGDRGFARDTHLRFIEAHARTVLGVRIDHRDHDDPATMRRAVEDEAGEAVPEDPFEQLVAAIGAVFESWDSTRARAYREHRGISHEGGTAVTVQAMVFGNRDENSGTGVFFTRDPATGSPEPYGDFLPCGQGEDVVSGEVDPVDLDTLRQQLPDVHADLLRAGETLERAASDVQDIEFTVDAGQLYVLQTRTAKRSPSAALRIAVDLTEEGLISREEALHRISPAQVQVVLKETIDPDVINEAVVLAEGESACPGIASGLAVDDPDEVVRRSTAGESVVLVRRATSPEDIHGMIAATGICTEVGGRTSHAAVVSRELGRPSVVGCGEGTVAVLVGQIVTIDGDSGTIYQGELPAHQPGLEGHPMLRRLAIWADEHPGVLDDSHPLSKLATEI